MNVNMTLVNNSALECHLEVNIYASSDVVNVLLNV